MDHPSSAGLQGVVDELRACRASELPLGQSLRPSSVML